jgi:peptidyl-prolyl cis-trans isomerase C
MKITKALRLALLLATAMIPAASLMAADDPVVARVNGVEIHRSQVERVRMSNPQMAQAPMNIIYPMLLEHLVNEQILSDVARQKGMLKDADVKKGLKAAETRILASALAAKVAKEKVTDAMVKAEYETFVKQLPPSEEVQASHILVKEEAEAKEIIAKLKGGADFVALAKEKSIDPQGKGGGDLGYFRKEEMVPEFSEAAFKLKNGEVSAEPVKSQFGWHVIKTVDRRPAKPPALDDVKDEIHAGLARQELNKEIEALASKAKVERFNLDGTPRKEEGEGASPEKKDKKSK